MYIGGVAAERISLTEPGSKITDLDVGLNLVCIPPRLQRFSELVDRSTVGVANGLLVQVLWLCAYQLFRPIFLQPTVGSISMTDAIRRELRRNVFHPLRRR